jgi:hypothetical protein
MSDLSPLLREERKSLLGPSGQFLTHDGSRSIGGAVAVMSQNSEVAKHVLH